MPKSVTELAVEFAECIGGPEKYKRFDVWYLCLHTCVQIYKMAPIKDKVRMTQLALGAMQEEFGMEIQGMQLSDPPAFIAERKRIDRELS